MYRFVLSVLFWSIRYGCVFFLTPVVKSIQDVVLTEGVKVGAKCALTAGDSHGLSVPLMARIRSL